MLFLLSAATPQPVAPRPIVYDEVTRMPASQNHIPAAVFYQPSFTTALGFVKSNLKDLYNYLQNIPVDLPCSPYALMHEEMFRRGNDIFKSLNLAFDAQTHYCSSGEMIIICTAALFAFFKNYDAKSIQVAKATHDHYEDQLLRLACYSIFLGKQKKGIFSAYVIDDHASVFDALGSAMLAFYYSRHQQYERMHHALIAFDRAWFKHPVPEQIRRSDKFIRDVMETFRHQPTPPLSYPATIHTLNPQAPTVATQEKSSSSDHSQVPDAIEDDKAAQLIAQEAIRIIALLDDDNAKASATANPTGPSILDDPAVLSVSREAPKTPVLSPQNSTPTSSPKRKRAPKSHSRTHYKETDSFIPRPRSLQHSDAKKGR